MITHHHPSCVHLVFLRALAAKGEDKAFFALKGGCNLRFFFGSVRCSEDIDIDASVVAKGTLKNKVDRLLRAPTVVSPLQAHSIAIVDISAPKQTDTPQRWKVGLRVEGVPSRCGRRLNSRAARHWPTRYSSQSTAGCFARTH